MAQDIQKFDVGVKAFIEKDGKILLTKEISNKWEIPGGRYNVGEEAQSPMEILRREVLEELGPKFKIEIGLPYYAWVRPWGNGYRDGQFVFLLGYRCVWLSGEPELSDEHLDCRWISREEIDTLDFAPGYKEAVKQYWAKKT